MRPRALQSCRPLLSSSRRLQCLVQPAFVASVSTEASSSTTTTTTATPAAATATTSKKTTPPKFQTKKPTTSYTSSKLPYYHPTRGTTPAPSFPGMSVDQVDVESAKQIPTPLTSPAAFIAALTTSSPGLPDLNSNGKDENGNPVDWSSSFHGLSTTAFSPEAAAILMAPIDPHDVEIKPDGIVYLPEIKYRRILNKAFGPGGWGLAPRGELVVGEKVVTREYALVVNGRFVAQARGECQYFSTDTIPTAGEGAKSNALMRCCKDIGIASELWDPRFLRTFKKEHGHEVWVEHVVSKKRRQIWKRKDCDPGYPFQNITSK